MENYIPNNILAAQIDLKSFRKDTVLSGKGNRVNLGRFWEKRLNTLKTFYAKFSKKCNKRLFIMINLVLLQWFARNICKSVNVILSHRWTQGQKLRESSIYIYTNHTTILDGRSPKTLGIEGTDFSVSKPDIQVYTQHYTTWERNSYTEIRSKSAYFLLSYLI